MGDKTMTTFTKLVADRASSPLASPYSASQAPGAHNPLARKPVEASPLAQTAPTEKAQRSATSSNTSPAHPVKPAPKSYNGGGSKGMNDKWAKERAETHALLEKVDSIQLSYVMQILGAAGNQDNDRSKWKIPAGENVTVTGQKWWNLQAEKGGVGAASLVMHVMDLKFHLAVRWLAKEFGESIDSDDIKASMESMKSSPKKTFLPPNKSDKNIQFVKHYLKMVRRIPEKIIEDLIAQNRIYADDDRNCVFASDGIAELRGSHDGPDAVKKLAPGSTRSQGFLVLPEPDKNEHTLAICESAIDSMSYRALNPGRAAISSAGAGRNFPRSVAEDAVAGGFKVVAAFDADMAGDKASQALFNHFYLKLWLKHKGQAELGRKFSDEELFALLDDKTVTCTLSNGAPGSDDNDSFDEAPEGAPSEAEAANGPNLLFFNKSTAFDNPNQKPTILVNIKRNQFGLPVCANFPIEVSQKGYEFVTTQTGITRDRPRGEKDWNELIKKREVSPSLQSASKPS